MFMADVFVILVNGNFAVDLALVTRTYLRN